MLVEESFAREISEPAEWIWSDWLKEQRPTRLRYERFKHQEFVEDTAKRPAVQDKLAKLLYDYHSHSPVDIKLLEQLRYRQLASVLASSFDQRPSDIRTRLAN